MRAGVRRVRYTTTTSGGSHNRHRHRPASRRRRPAAPARRRPARRSTARLFRTGRRRRHTSSGADHRARIRRRISDDQQQQLRASAIHDQRSDAEHDLLLPDRRHELEWHDEGTIMSFKTLSAPPSVTTVSAAATATGATLNGTVNPNGANTNASFDWGKTSSLGSSTRTRRSVTARARPPATASPA